MYQDQTAFGDKFQGKRKKKKKRKKGKEYVAKTGNDEPLDAIHGKCSLPHPPGEGEEKKGEKREGGEERGGAHEKLTKKKRQLFEGTHCLPSRERKKEGKNRGTETTNPL